MAASRRRRKKKATTCPDEEEEKMLEFFSKKYWKNVGSTIYLKNVVIFVGKMLLQHFLKNVDR
jgi:hypothetical protein